jgi:signal transduction histidine kinase
MNVAPRRTAGWRLYVNVLAPLLIVVLLMVVLAVGSVRMLGAARGYVGGESLWSKAVQHLREYAQSRDPHDFERFERSLAVPLADRAAREAMERPQPDRAAIRAHFVKGGIHPDDIDSMVNLFLWFGDTSLFAEALGVWSDADTQVARLQEQARLLRQQLGTSQDVAAIEATMAEIERLSEDLRSLEVRFTTSLGAASRLTQSLLMGGLGVAGALLSIVSFMMIRRPLDKHAAQQLDLAQAHWRLELAVAGSDLGLFEIDYATGRAQLDARTAGMCGLSPKPCTLSREEMYRLMPPDDRDKSAQAIEQAQRTGEMFKTLTRIALPDGQIRYLETTGRSMDNLLSGGRRLMGVARDVTQEKAQAKRAMERDAAQKIAVSQRAFLSRLSHELRTPLNAVLGFAQLLSIDKMNPLAPTQLKQVHWILDAGDQLLHLIEDVLDLTKVETGEISMHVQPCSLAETLHAALPLIDAARQRFNVQVISHLPDPSPYVMADPNRLLQVFMNLLSNGCKYNKPGGQITVNARVEGNHVRIDFGDSGIGLTPEEAATLFQPFQRVPMASAKVEGTGLGLYIVRQLVERMRGSVDLRSEPGVGSCFTVTLPLALALQRPPTLAQ